MYIKLHTDFNLIFDEFLKDEEFKQLLNKVDQLYLKETIYPSKDNIFRCFDFFNIKDTKVVIIGQDPYHEPNQANGLAFSVDNTCKLPKSLINIFKELKSDLNINKTEGDLSSWAQQGVLLLNSCLTVQQHKPLSHAYLNWEKYTDKIIKYLSDYCNNIVYILWGKNAISKKKIIDETKNLVITSSHPSPLSAYRGFFGSKPFSKTNDYLIKNKIKSINWN